MIPTWLKVVYYALIGIGAAAEWTFIIRYTSTYRWWKTELGRHLITFSACLASFETSYVVTILWPHYPGREIVQLALFTLLTAAIVWRLVMFERIRRHGNGNGGTT